MKTASIYCGNLNMILVIKLGLQADYDLECARGKLNDVDILPLAA
jgi:hypothetical protein